MPGRLCLTCLSDRHCKISGRQQEASNATLSHMHKRLQSKLTWRTTAAIGSPSGESHTYKQRCMMRPSGGTTLCSVDCGEISKLKTPLCQDSPVHISTSRRPKAWISALYVGTTQSCAISGDLRVMRQGYVTHLYTNWCWPAPLPSEPCPSPKSARTVVPLPVTRTFS